MTSFNNAFAGVTTLGFDTAPIIYFIERHPIHHLPLRQVFEQVDIGPIAGISSFITLTEVLTKPFQFADTSLIAKYRALLLHSRNFRLAIIDEVTAERR